MASFKSTEKIQFKKIKTTLESIMFTSHMMSITTHLDCGSKAMILMDFL